MRRVRFARTTVAVLIAAAVATAPSGWAAPSKTLSAASMPSASAHFPVWRGGEASLPNHTILRPAELRDVGYRLPVVIWANGGCRQSNMEFNYFLTNFASYGYMVIAEGAPDNPYDPSEVSGMVLPKPTSLIDAIDWATRQNSDKGSRYFGKLDLTRVAVMGQSCGGYQAINASADSRVRSTIVWNSGDDANDPAAITKLHAPVLFVHGGTFDYMNWDAIASYNAASVPTVLASLEGPGHTGLWDDPAPPAKAPSSYQVEPLFVAQQWLAFTLYGTSNGRGTFLGAACGLCQKAGWTVQSRGWEA